MAKKLRKVRISRRRLLALLIVPWIVLGGLVLALIIAGIPEYAAILIGLAGSLVVTYLIGRYITGLRTAGSFGSVKSQP